MKIFVFCFRFVASCFQQVSLRLHHARTITRLAHLGYRGSMTALPPPRIVAFLAEHHVLTLATARDGAPWCAHAYYAYMEGRNRFVIASDPETRHMRELLDTAHRRAAWAVALETKIVGKVRGIQCAGRLVALEGAALAEAKAAYLGRFPVARMMPRLDLWGLEPESLKLTDNRLGFGTKVLWNAEDAAS
jgi:hypothetical protein